MTKLTLSVDEKVADKAKKIAESQGTSVSAMFSQFVQSLGAGKHTEIRPGRIARQASGLIQLPPDVDEKELVARALRKKHGIQK